MRPNTDRNIRHTGTLVGEDVRMGIDENSLAHLMDVLTDLYSNPTLAVIREYSTNALDSHRAAGNDDPIEVTLPSAFEPTFIVKDNGVGLSVDDLRDIYSKYGLSTKRETDDEVGMLGLGCKSGLTYTSSFTIEAIKEGVKATALITRGEDGVGTIRIVDTVSTDEPNGVTVKVPVKDADEFAGEARSFFRFWNEGDVLVDGKAPEPIGGVRVDDDTIVSSKLDACYLVMGGVPYNAERGGDWRTMRQSPCAHLPYSYHVVKWVGMGEVNFPPNRESLAWTPRTEAVVRTLREDIGRKIKATAQRDIAAAPNAAEAFDRAVKWTPLSNEKFVWQGHDIPTRFDCAGSFLWKPNGWGRAKTTKVSGIARAEIGNVVQVVNFDLKSVVTSHRQKTQEYLDEHDIELPDRDSCVLFTSEQVGSPWTDNGTIIDYEADIKPIRLSKGGTAAGTNDGPTTYYTYMDGTWEDLEIDDIAGEDVIVYSPAMTSSKRRSDRPLSVKAVRSLFPDAVLVCAGQNSWSKIKREVDNVRTITEAVAARRDDFIENLTPAQVFALRTSRYDTGTFGTLDPDRIEDADLAAAVRNARGAGGHAITQETWQNIRNVCYQLRLTTGNLPDNTLLDDIQKQQERYPLIDTSHKNATYEYVNAVYRMRKDSE